MLLPRLLPRECRWRPQGALRIPGHTASALALLALVLLVGRDGVGCTHQHAIPTQDPGSQQHYHHQQQQPGSQQQQQQQDDNGLRGRAAAVPYPSSAFFILFSWMIDSPQFPTTACGGFDCRRYNLFVLQPLNITRAHVTKVCCLRTRALCMGRRGSPRRGCASISLELQSLPSAKGSNLTPRRLTTLATPHPPVYFPRSFFQTQLALESTSTLAHSYKLRHHPTSP